MYRRVDVVISDRDGAQDKISSGLSSYITIITVYRYCALVAIPVNGDWI